MQSGFSRGIAVTVIVFILTAVSLAAIPQQINYQGRLTDPNGSPLVGPVNLVFSICADSTCGNELWEETHTGIVLNDGLFSVILGTVTPLPLTVFDGSVRYLSATLNGEPVTRRIAIGSVGYSYRALVSDTAVAIRGGGTTDCSDCNATFVNTTGPDTVTTVLGAALYGRALGSQTSSLYGLRGFASNTSSGNAYGGHFLTSINGTGDHFALYADGAGSSSSAVFGLDATASNSSSGPAYAARLTVESGGTGQHYGAYINSEGNGTLSMYGVWSEATNASSGNAYGGYFRGASGGTGDHFGVSGNGACASDASAYGSYGYATNTSTGDAYGGYFSASSSGTGVHYGAKTQAFGSSSSPVHGIQSIGQNTGSGSTYGGSFFAHDDGTGHHYGLYSEAITASSNEAFAVYAIASSRGPAEAYGGYFAVNGSAGATTVKGVSGTATMVGNGTAIGVHGWAENNNETGHKNAIGGRFGVSSLGVGYKVAVWAEAPLEGNSFAGWFDGRVLIQDKLSVTGEMSKITKMADNTYRSLHCQQSPEVWAEDFGGGRLVNGRAHVELDPLFLQTVTINTEHEIRVFIQLEGVSSGVYVEKGTTGFDVIEQANGTGEAAFSYRVVAKPKGCENKRLDLYTGQTPEQHEVMRTIMNAQFDANRAGIQSEQERNKLEHKATIQKIIQPEVD